MAGGKDMLGAFTSDFLILLDHCIHLHVIGILHNEKPTSSCVERQWTEPQRTNKWILNRGQGVKLSRKLDNWKVLHPGETNQDKVEPPVQRFCKGSIEELKFS